MAGQGPMNQFSHAEAFPPASFRDVVRPNFDTLYSVAWLDMGLEPLVMTLAKTDRYHVFQMMDCWTEVFAAPGTRMTGGKGGNYLIVGPNWQGDTPRDMELLRSPTRSSGSLAASRQTELRTSISSTSFKPRSSWSPLATGARATHR